MFFCQKKLPEPKSAPIIVKKDAPITIKKDEVSKVTMVEPFSFQNREEQLLEKRKRVFEEGQKIKLVIFMFYFIVSRQNL